MSVMRRRRQPASARCDTHWLPPQPPGPGPAITNELSRLIRLCWIEKRNDTRLNGMKWISSCEGETEMRKEWTRKRKMNEIPASRRRELACFPNLSISFRLRSSVSLFTFTTENLSETLLSLSSFVYSDRWRDMSEVQGHQSSRNSILLISITYFPR